MALGTPITIRGNALSTQEVEKKLSHEENIVALHGRTSEWLAAVLIESNTFPPQEGTEEEINAQLEQTASTIATKLYALRDELGIVQDLLAFGGAIAQMSALREVTRVAMANLWQVAVAPAV